MSVEKSKYGLMKLARERAKRDRDMLARCPIELRAELRADLRQLRRAEREVLQARRLTRASE